MDGGHHIRIVGGEDPYGEMLVIDVWGVDVLIVIGKKLGC
jgi:hypothetical protein